MRQYKSCLESPLVSYYLEEIINFLTCIIDPSLNILKDPKTVQNIIEPYLDTLIKAAKRQQALESLPVIHISSFGVFLKQHDLDNMVLETSRDNKIKIRVNDQLQVSISLFLNFDIISLTLHLSFYQLDELLRMNTLLQTSSSQDYFVEGTDMSLLIKDGITLNIGSVSYHLEKSHWQNLCHLLDKVEQTFSKQLHVLRTQFGSL